MIAPASMPWTVTIMRQCALLKVISNPVQRNSICAIAAQIVPVAANNEKIRLIKITAFSNRNVFCDRTAYRLRFISIIFIVARIFHNCNDITKSQKFQQLMRAFHLSLGKKPLLFEIQSYIIELRFAFFRNSPNGLPSRWRRSITKECSLTHET